MPKWSANDNRIFDNATGWCQYAAGPGFAAAIVERHNTDIDALTARAEAAEAELARLRNDEDDNLSAVYMAGRHDGRKQRLDAEAEQVKQEAAELRSALSGRNQDIHIADMYTSYDGRVDIVPTGEYELVYYLNGKRLVPEPETVADAQTLESLAEIGIRSYEADDTNNYVEAWCAATAAILRAAKPRLDIAHDDAIVYRTGQTQIHGRDVAALNFRIRYTVAVPQPEPTNKEIEELARRLRRELRGCDDWDSCDVLESARNDWRAVARAAWAHLKGGK